MITYDDLEEGLLFEYDSPYHDGCLRLVIVYDESKEIEPYDINSIQLLDVDRFSIFNLREIVNVDLLTFLNSKKVKKMKKCDWLEPMDIA